jgi:hypothetical protein
MTHLEWILDYPSGGHMSAVYLKICSADSRGFHPKAHLSRSGLGNVSFMHFKLPGFYQ